MFSKKFSILLIAVIVFLTLLFSYKRPRLEFRYVKVKQGDTFWKLFKDKWEITSRINRIDRWHLLPGITLRVPLDWELAKEYPFFPKFLEQEKEVPKLILVVIQEQFLAGYEYGELKFWYPICSGMEKELTPYWYLKMEAEIQAKKDAENNQVKTYPTPRGRFEILYKELNHKSSFYPEPDGGQLMPYAAMFSWSGYGFHAWGVPKPFRKWYIEKVKENLQRKKGELSPEIDAELLTDLEKYSLGRMPGWPASHGCIRLFFEDAINFFKWVRAGTVVLIISSFEDSEK